MKQLSIAEAIAAVRKNLDEIGLNESIMYTEESTDNDSLDGVIARSLPEAINLINKTAPVTLLEGVDYSGGPFNSAIIENGSLVLSFTADYLRLVAFQTKDSPIVVTDVLDEASPEGRKQLNPYIRGTYDRPRLVGEQGARGTYVFRYYSLKDTAPYENNPMRAIKRFSFVKEQFYEEGAEGYPIPEDLRQNIIDELTALVLAVYGENEKANYFAEKAKI